MLMEIYGIIMTESLMLLRYGYSKEVFSMIMRERVMRKKIIDLKSIAHKFGCLSKMG